MADIIHLNYQLLSVINRFGIELGFGNLRIDEVCEKHNIQVGFFLEIVNTFHDENYFPGKQLQSFSVSLIVDYLKRTHYYYLENKPDIVIGNSTFLRDSRLMKQKKQNKIKWIGVYKVEKPIDTDDFDAWLFIDDAQQVVEQKLQHIFSVIPTDDSEKMRELTRREKEVLKYIVQMNEVENY